MVLVAYNEAIDDEILELLNAASVDGYTKWTKVLGRGAASGPHLLTHVWPKANNVVAVCAEDEQAQNILQGVRDLRETVGREGVKAFLLPVEAIT